MEQTKPLPCWLTEPRQRGQRSNPNKSAGWRKVMGSVIGIQNSIPAAPASRGRTRRVSFAWPKDCRQRRRIGNRKVRKELIGFGSKKSTDGKSYHRTVQPS